jgi:hypothetical protein
VWRTPGDPALCSACRTAGPEPNDTVASSMFARPAPPRPSEGDYGLTGRERGILQLLVNA